MSAHSPAAVVPLLASLLLASCGKDGIATTATDAVAPGPLFLFDAASLDCTDSGPPAPDASRHDASTCIASRHVSYVNDVVPIFAENCTGEVCHNGSWGGGAARESLVDVPAPECCGRRLLVFPGDPAASYVMSKLRGVGMCGGRPMPLDRTIDPRDIATIADWICEGAPSD